MWEIMWFIWKAAGESLCESVPLSAFGIFRERFPWDGVSGAAERFTERAACCAAGAWKRGEKKMRECVVSPCYSCTRVRDPAACENKNCRQWRQWFAESWEQTRMNPALQRELKKVGIETVNVGGFHYAHPDRVKEYVQTDPCESCPFPSELCTSPCPARRAWMETRKEVKL